MASTPEHGKPPSSAVTTGSDGAQHPGYLSASAGKPVGKGKRDHMATCESRGDDDDTTSTMTRVDGGTDMFDRVDCAAVEFARPAGHHAYRVLGQDMHAGDTMYRSPHCAGTSGDHDRSHRPPVEG